MVRGMVPRRIRVVDMKLVDALPDTEADDPTGGVCVVAEAGQCHEGNFERAVAMIVEAAEAGADYIKFQLLQPHTIAAPAAPKYWEHGDDLDQRGVFLRNGVLPYRAHLELAACAKEHGIGLIGTPFDLEAVEVLADIGNPIKIASGDITNVLLLEAVADTQLPVILSTGAATEQEIDTAVDTLRSLQTFGTITLLACSLEYPTPPERAALGRIQQLQMRFPYPIGYSDHTTGTWAAIAATAAGAGLLEKHFTIPGWTKPVPDHEMGLIGRAELAEYVQNAKLGHAAQSIYALEPHHGEAAARLGARRSWYTTTAIRRGEPFSSQNSAPLRPYLKDAMPASEDLYDGSTAATDLEAGKPIMWGEAEYLF